MKNKTVLAMLMLFLVVSGGAFFLFKKKDLTTVFGSKPTLQTQLLGAWVEDLSDPQDPECKHAGPDDICFPHDSNELYFTVEDGKKIFNSYIHQRPDSTGCIWSSKGKKIEIQCQESMYSFVVYSITSEVLVLDREGNHSTYKRIK